MNSISESKKWMERGLAFTDGKFQIDFNISNQTQKEIAGGLSFVERSFKFLLCRLIYAIFDKGIYHETFRERVIT